MLVALAFLLGSASYLLWWEVPPNGIVELAAVGGWGLDGTDGSVIVSHDNRNLFQVQPAVLGK